jgi:transcriptional regulator with XRE-family HTH domain
MLMAMQPPEPTPPEETAASKLRREMRSGKLPPDVFGGAQGEVFRDRKHRRERPIGEVRPRRRPRIEPVAGHDPLDPATVGPFPAGGLVRRVRQLTGLSQRQLANRAKVSPATIGRVESGEMMPSLAVLQRLVGAAGLYLAVVDQEGRVVAPPADREWEHDRGGRHYPMHLERLHPTRHDLGLPELDERDWP